MRLDNKDSEPKAQVTGYLRFQNKIKIFRDISSNNILSFPNIRIKINAFSRKGNCTP